MVTVEVVAIAVAEVVVVAEAVPHQTLGPIKILRLKTHNLTNPREPNTLTFPLESGRGAGCIIPIGKMHTFVLLRLRVLGKTSSLPGLTNEAPASSVTINHRKLI